MNTQIFIMNGMHCEACTKLTAKRMQGIKGVIGVSVDLATQAATLQVEHVITVSDINTALAGTGYSAKEVQGEDN